jgi:type I restriction enzyme M protein
LTTGDIARVASTYHAWRGERGADDYTDVLGFCKTVPFAEVRKHGYVLTPGRFVGSEALEDNSEHFDERMQRLTVALRDQRAEAARLDSMIAANLDLEPA